MTVVFLDLEKTFESKWHSVLLNKWFKLEFYTNLFTLISAFLSHWKFRVSVGDTPRYSKEYASTRATRFRCVPHTTHLVHEWYTRNKWLQSRSLCWHLSVCDILQGGLCSQKTPAHAQFNGGLVWALNIKLFEYKTQPILFSSN
jgi:hypothetical protein